MTQFLLALVCSLICSITLAAERVGVKTISYYDPARRRPLITEIMYPIDSKIKTKSLDQVWKEPEQARNAPFGQNPKKLPLILFSHGDGGSRLDSSWFLAAMVKAGYLVASVDHYGNTWYLHLPDVSLRRWERPQDVSFVLKELLKDPELGPHIDPERVGFAGFSLGGLTGVWLAGGKANLYRKPQQASSHYTELAELADQEDIDKIDFTRSKESFYEPLIKAAFLMAPAYGFAFDSAGLKTIQTPVMIVSGKMDSVVPIHENAEHFARQIPNSKLKILEGRAGHFVFLNEPTPMGKKALRPILVQDDRSVSRSQVHEQVGKLAQEFFDKTLR